ncbi:hypothetical protein AJ80_01880 [Polytolypa hystricis UAMH7299]|uniref:SRR1-like domain-containing protein n=1 Tax=Polytolypa hystricis (strain UAMH7299) TaxID=1447883 RepID=A0A2B7YZY6_POLH7|nr:hypothetical protein AJ80_01880 [Polytolypa hystricis UAMH7299]
MGRVIYLLPARYTRPGKAYDHDDADQAVGALTSFYMSEKTLFAKERIRDVFEQCRWGTKKGDIIKVVGLDGVILDFHVDTGDIRPLGDGTELLLNDPVIEFEPYHSLIESTHHNPDLAYINMPISHDCTRRDAITKKPIHGVPIQTHEEVAKFFQDTSQQWAVSEACQQVILTFTGIQPLEVTKIVIFACGPMTTVREEDKLCSRSAFQHALALTIRDAVAGMAPVGQSGTIPCYIQDPAYSDIDISVLEKNGFVHLPNPEGFLEVDESTVALSFAPNVPVRQIVSDIAQPAILIWDTVKNDGQNDSMMVDPEGKRLQKWTEKLYDVFEFPEDLEHFPTLSIYVRKDGRQEYGKTTN